MSEKITSMSGWVVYGTVVVQCMIRFYEYDEECKVTKSAYPDLINPGDIIPKGKWFATKDASINAVIRHYERLIAQAVRDVEKAENVLKRQPTAACAQIEVEHQKGYLVGYQRALNTIADTTSPDTCGPTIHMLPKDL